MWFDIFDFMLNLARIRYTIWHIYFYADFNILYEIQYKHWSTIEKKKQKYNSQSNAIENRHKLIREKEEE